MLVPALGGGVAPWLARRKRKESSSPSTLFRVVRLAYLCMSCVRMELVEADVGGKSAAMLPLPLPLLLPEPPPLPLPLLLLLLLLLLLPASDRPWEASRKLELHCD